MTPNPRQTFEGNPINRMSIAPRDAGPTNHRPRSTSIAKRTAARSSSPVSPATSGAGGLD